ncbi:bifunctional diguanylate cyclase/phosphodiesterase [Psychromonas antarctica]|uniref:sensor domain-containing protein n=1 Tax=Psychromonas antarctica TaxID=67573 RepID=UPI001EE90517|nr:diguanylate cyclase [Psychromonas antarctica]MCG6202201.1 diguanylate cyclase [Psychromonas antarctica]
MNDMSKKRLWRKRLIALPKIKVLLVVLVLVTLAAALRVWCFLIFKSDLVWLTFYPAVIVAALYGGLYAGLLAILLAYLAVSFLSPLFITIPFSYHHRDIMDMALFIATCTLISLLVEVRHGMRRALVESKLRLKASRKRELFIRELIDYMPNMIGYWDSDLRCRFANKAFSEWFGKEPEQIIGITFKELVGEDLFALNEPHIRRVLAGDLQRFERTISKADGSVGHIIGHYIPDYDSNGRVKGFSTQASEITDLKEMQGQLKMAACVFDNTLDGVIITDSSGVILSVNPAFSDITGYSAEEAVGETPRLLKSDRHDQTFYAAMWTEILNKGKWSGEIWNRRKDGDIFLERLTISLVIGEDGKPFRYVSVFSDITDLWHKDEHLKHLAFYDALTDLPNRTLLMERLDQKIISCQRTKQHFALMFIDLDGFKLINDQFGHNVGDELLKLVAERLSGLVRQSDTVSRLGGDEFIFIANNLQEKEEISYIASRVLKSINERMDILGEVVQVGASIGIALFPQDGETCDALINNADTAMYAAKSTGKNNFIFYTSKK